MIGERAIKENQVLIGQTALSVPPLFSKIFSKTFYLFVFLFVFLFFCLPIMKLLFMSFVAHSGLSLVNYSDLFREAKTWKTINNTLVLACGSTLVAVILGISAAWLVAYSDIRGKKLIQAMVLMSFIIPSYVLTLSWIQLFSPDGLLARMLSFVLGGEIKPWNLYSYSGMIFVMGLHHYPLVYLLCLSGFRKIPRDLEWASRVSGVGKSKTFFLVNIPLALPGIANGGLLAFIASLDNFGIPAFLGIPAQISVLSTSIYEEMTGFGPTALARSACLSAMLGILSICATLVQWLFVRNSRRFESIQEDYEPRFSFGKYKGMAEGLVWTVLLLMVFVPLLSMGFQSLVRAYGVPIRWGNLTFANYEFILFQNAKVQHAINNSLMLSLSSVLICLVIGTGIAYFRVRKPSFLTHSMEMMIGLPYAIPGVVFALAMILTWMEPVPGWNPGIYGSTTILLIAYIGRFLILQVRGSMTAILQVDPAMEEASRICGVNGIKKWWFILIPLILPGVMNGALLVLLTALTELTVSSLLWSSGAETIGVVIFNFEQGGSTNYSTAMSSLIVFVILIAAALYVLLQKAWAGKVEKS